jgi:hypothetical protein
MTTPNDPNTKALSPDQLANQLFDAALMQSKGDPRETARQVIVFLMEALIYAISGTAGDDNARKALLKSVGDTIISAPPPPKKP